MRKIKEESRMLDEKTTRSRLLEQESKNTRRMIKELIFLRRKKLLTRGSPIEMSPSEGLTTEEEKLVKNANPSLEFYHELLKDVLSGKPTSLESPQKRKTILRFLKEVPAIIGADMKTYGPFRTEDIAALPQENAKILLKQKAVVEVEAKL